MDQDSLRETCLKFLRQNGSARIEDITEPHAQPREPVKKMLEDLCEYDKGSKTYKLRPHFNF
jgi:hypothetical protein